MPENSRVVTVWVRKKYLLLTPLCLMLVGALWFVWSGRAIGPGTRVCEVDSELQVRTIQAEGRAIEVEIAQTGDQKVRGLSGRHCLAADKGLLFPYDLSGDYCYWMKDMKFAIDMIWLDDEQKVVTIKENVSPNTFPQSFCPDKPAKYVLEVNAGFVRDAGWHVGTQFEL